jgi:serine/threonine-protein kinase
LPPERPQSQLVDGRYRLVETLGAGSMGVVWRAEDVFLERTVALKFIDPGNARDDKTLERFQLEARALAKLKPHPNVVQVWTFGPHAGSFYFAMEFIAGRSIESIIDEHNTREEVFDLARAMRIVRAIGSGLQAVHDQKLVHRDVKPANIVLEKDTARPVLIDFGLARKRSSSSPRMSITAGTPMYMAPEQARDADGTKATFRADLYSFACTFWEMVTGRCVFTSEKDDVYEVLLKHLKEPPPRISASNPELAPLDAVLIKALAKDPLDRYESATAFVAALEAGVKKIEDARKPLTTSKMKPMTGPVKRVVVLAAEDGIRRRITKTVERAIEGSARTPAIDAFATVEEAWESLRAMPASIVVLDEEASPAPIAQLVANVRRLPGGRTTTIVVISRDIPSLADLREALRFYDVMDVLPKPLNLQMLSAAIGRILARREAAG